MSRHIINQDHAKCCCVNSFCNLHWQPPKSHICSDDSLSYELYWLPADPTSGCPIDERNPRAVMIGAVTEEIPRILAKKGIPLSLWQRMTSELLNDAPPTTVYFGLMVVPICFALPCALANCLRLHSWNRFMTLTVNKYKQQFKELGIDIEWHPIWLPTSGDDNWIEDDNEKYDREGCSRLDEKGGPTLRFIFQRY